MALRRILLKWVYPLFRSLSGKGKNGIIIENENGIVPPHSFYTLGATGNKGGLIDFGAWRGKYVLIVNTASDCGFTPQYAELQKLYEQYQDRLVVVGFPANDFREQERGTDEDIADFCRLNYGVTFPLVKKSVVVPRQNQHPVYQWLTQKAQNGWNDQPPVWNFSKYLVNPQGVLTHYLGPAISPSDIAKYLQKSKPET